MSIVPLRQPICDALTYGGINDRLLEMSKRHLKKRFRSHSYRHVLASTLVDIALADASTLTAERVPIWFS